MAFIKVEGDTLRDCQRGWLPMGTVVRFARHARKLAGKTGIIERFKTKNYAVLVGEQNWNVPPSIIGEIDPSINEFEKLQAARATPTVTGGGEQAWLDDEVTVGDVVLFNRGAGSYDIARVERTTTQGKPFCKVMNGRGRGKVYGMQRRWYICKLPRDRFDG